MPAHRLEVADVFREHARAYLAKNGTPLDHRRVLRDIVACRTAALGGHVKRCDKCGHEEFFYKSCANRHCPKCQGSARAKWVDARAADLLDTRYFHIIFTLPHKLGPIALQNKRLVYGILFRAVSETLLEVARRPKNLGAEIGFLAVLHTWGQNLLDHPHVHCVVPGGGVSLDGTKWISSPKKFFVHVKILSKVFRAKFLDYLREAFRKGQLSLEGNLRYLKEPASWSAKLQSVKKGDWVVHAKRPFGGPKQVLKYLARYTHRVAISNQRLVSMKDGKVTFRWKDYAHGGRQREMTLKANEFIRRFLLHVLPNRFHRIRQYGLLANRHRTEKLELCRRLLAQGPTPDASASEGMPNADVEPALTHKEDSERCSACSEGSMVWAADIKPDRRLIERLFRPQANDTS